MASSRAGVITAAIEAAISESNAVGYLTSSPNQQPRAFWVSHGGVTTELWTYAWTLTPGGRPQLRHEYRIQMTSVGSPLPTNPKGPTLLLGYEPQRDVFVGFDLVKHSVFTPGSPSVQVDVRILDKAKLRGIAVHRKANDEIAVAFRPDHFVAYFSDTDAIHEAAPNNDFVQIFDSMTSAPEVLPDLQTLSPTRRRLVHTVSRLSRSASFRREVLGAYDHRCAVTGIQLRLVDAAHILPVGAEGSVDDVRNGVALSPTFHRAFDRGVIYLDEDLEMRPNNLVVTKLKLQGLSDGVDQLISSLGPLHLPSDQQRWPDKAFIQKGNHFRGIP